jgi:hypothetical protein
MKTVKQYNRSAASSDPEYCNRYSNRTDQRLDVPRHNCFSMCRQPVLGQPLHEGKAQQVQADPGDIFNKILDCAVNKETKF